LVKGILKGSVFYSSETAITSAVCVNFRLVLTMTVRQLCPVAIPAWNKTYSCPIEVNVGGLIKI
jgi:hypothetical protein